MAKIYKIILLLLFLGLLPSGAEAATLSFSPSFGSHASGNTFSVGVFVSSADQAMNAASGAVSFPADKLEVISLSKTGSIFTLWVQEPSFSNSAGTINFEGIVLNPGFTGSAGKAITINFKAKAAGAAAVNFSSGSVLANDGKGTNILASLGSAQFSLAAAASTAPSSVSKATAPFVVPSALSAPKISSPTHPDQTEWYAKKDAKFTWPIPDGATRVRLLVGKIPLAIPTVVYSPAISEREVTNFEDGIWYFNAQLRNAGGWGEVAHFKLQIDTQPPKPFAIKFIDGVKTENPKPTVVFDTTDALSGLDYYKIKIGEGDFSFVAPEIVKTNPYTFPPQSPGKRNILVQAFDKAGNYTTAVEEFEILPISSPRITEYPKEMRNEELLVVRGSTHPNSQVTIWLQKEGEEPKSFVVQSNQDGKFAYLAEDKLKEGSYKMWATVTNAQEAQSLPTEKINIEVLQPTIFRAGTVAISFLIVAIPVAALLFALIFVVWFSLYKISLFKKRVRKEVREAESAIHKSFDALKKNMREQMRMLEKARTKRQLTEEEGEIIKQFKKDLADAETFVNKEIQDIEKTIK